MRKHYRPRGPLGILDLANPDVAPDPPEAAYNFEDWFSYPVITREVPGAYAHEIVQGNAGLAEAFAETARELEREGVSAITSHCGFAVCYQEAVQKAVSVPVALSSLMQLPMLAAILPARGRIGLVVFDSPQLTPELLRCAGLEVGDTRLAVRGIEGTASWRNWMAEVNTQDWHRFETETLLAARTLLSEHADVTHLLLECHGFPRVGPQLKAETGFPVFDWRTLCNYLMDSVA